MENTDFLKKIVACFNAASKDETRYHLNGVLIDSQTRPSTTCLVATDGHKLALETCPIENRPKEKLLVRKHNLALIKEAIKEYKYGCDIAWNDNVLSIGDKFQVVLEKSESYPNWEQLLPKQSSHDMVIGLNADYLLALAKALKASKNSVVKLTIKDKLSPITVTCPGNEYGEAVLMPCRV